MAPKLFYNYLAVGSMAIATPTLFIYFVFFITYRPYHIHTEQYIHPSFWPRLLSIFFIASLLRGKNLLGISDQDLNSGLPYSRPAHYQLNYAAPF
jgi:hypothetical protein